MGNVRDVLDVENFEFLVEEVALYCVHGDVGACMPEVGMIVGGKAADIHVDFSIFYGLEFVCLPGKRIIYLHRPMIGKRL